MTNRIFPSILFLLTAVGAVAAAPETAPAPASRPAEVLIIGASSVFGLSEYLQPMADSRGIPMHFYDTGVKLNAVDEMLKGKPHWDYLIMDAWHFGRGRTDPPAFDNAVADFVKKVRAHSPDCKIILFAWWLPSPDATNADVMKVFQRCVEAARPSGIWVATTGPAFTEARLARPDLQIVRSKTDAHPAPLGYYINACSLFAALTGQSPIGLPSTLTLPKPPPAQGSRTVCVVAPGDAKYLQELAWTVYQREIKNIRPAR